MPGGTSSFRFDQESWHKALAHVAWSGPPIAVKDANGHENALDYNPSGQVIVLTCDHVITGFLTLRNSQQL